MVRLGALAPLGEGRHAPQTAPLRPICPADTARLLRVGAVCRRPFVGVVDPLAPSVLIARQDRLQRIVETLPQVVMRAVLMAELREP